MANSIKFDRNEIIEKAMRIFWERGFNGTSMRDLQDALDLRPGSIYASFGGKEQLYSEALSCYSLGTLSCLEKLSQSHSATDAIRTFIKASVIDGMANAPSQVCMLIKTISELSGSNNLLVEQARSALNQIEKHFEELLATAQHQGELNPSLDPRMISKWLQVQIIGLKTYAQSGAQGDELESLISQSMKCLFTQS